MTALAFAALVALGALHEGLAIRWHRAREARLVARMVALGAVLECSAFAPLVAALEVGPWLPLAASVLGVTAGTLWGMRGRGAAPGR